MRTKTTCCAVIAAFAGIDGARVLRESSGTVGFDEFIQKYGRSYRTGTEEYEHRRALFEQAQSAAAKQNAQPDRLWTAGVNKLWDYTDEEFKMLRGWDGSTQSKSRPSPANSIFLQQKNPLPAAKIWDSLTTSRVVRNQGGCGSCWAIASATVLEAHAEIHTGHNRTFSAQQITSCTPNPKQCGGDGGCKGATAELAMEWVLNNGCATDAEVPYLGHDESCTMSSTLQMANALGGIGDQKKLPSAAFGMTGWETLPVNKYEPLARALAERGPVAVSASASPWQYYESGIFNGCEKDAVIDHAIVAVGFSADPSTGEKYWVIQNSWGIDWGEMGLIRIQRHDGDDYCGNNHKPWLGVGCKGETAPVPVCGMCGILFDSVVPHFGPVAAV